jgi:coenzyme F420-reducing hydrogenase alpha subunit
VPTHFKVSVPDINCFDDAKKLEINTRLRAAKWTLQLKLLEGAQECCQQKLLSLDKNMSDVPTDLVKLVSAKTFSYDEDSKVHMQNIAKHEYDKLKASEKLMRSYKKQQEIDSKNAENERVATAERKAKQNVVEGTAAKFAVLGNFVTGIVRSEMNVGAPETADAGAEEQQVELVLHNV